MEKYVLLAYGIQIETLGQKFRIKDYPIYVYVPNSLGISKKSIISYLRSFDISLEEFSMSACYDQVGRYGHKITPESDE